ncbi:hypothetical protein Ahy_B09g094973 isoform B [Arachis hypogaea]|uniref:FBD domain-containing protein n=1 Tax=Arachis hypogaea TaxID=3818 RepID=A0A444XCL9_ARAHY|nr:hypothetical protein Ahy_B09g094973 isoform B [Arachis hypogaea]
MKSCATSSHSFQPERPWPPACSLAGGATSGRKSMSWTSTMISFSPLNVHMMKQKPKGRFLNLLYEFEPLLAPIRKFRLSCWVGGNWYRDLLDWIDYFIRNVSELYFSLRTDGRIYNWDAFLLYNKSLVSLVLDGNMNILLDYSDPTASKTIFPSLKNLELHINHLNLDVLLSGCPVLETLNFRTDDTDFDSEAIHMPRPLKSLTFEEQYSHYENVTLELFECLIRAPVLNLPDFCNLIQLQLDFYGFNSTLLIDLLRNCPKLQTLKIYTSEFIDDHLRKSYRNSHKRNDWTQPLSVPNCIVSHLNTVEYRGYQDTPEEHEFTAYILQKGLVLKTMRIHAKYDNLDLKRRRYMALSEIQRGSSMCRLEVH